MPRSISAGIARTNYGTFHVEIDGEGWDYRGEFPTLTSAMNFLESLAITDLMMIVNEDGDYAPFSSAVDEFDEEFDAEFIDTYLV